MGYIPIVPHLSMLWHAITPKPYEFWLAYDLELLVLCNALLRLPGESSGADKEVEYAKKRGLMIFYSLEEIVQWQYKHEKEEESCKGPLVGFAYCV
jgi:hypothetical protein